MLQSQKHSDMKILVTGATGHFGKAVLDFLLTSGVPATSLAALVRDTAKAEELAAKGIELRTGDYTNPESLEKAFTGVDKLMLVSSSDLNDRTGQQANAVNAAKKAGVKYIVYTSFTRKDETDNSPIAFVAQSHVHTEKLIRESGMQYTILRNNLYMDFVPVFIGEKVLETGVYWPAGNGKGAYVLRNEMAEAAAIILSSEGHLNKEYNFSNTNTWDFEQVADAISKASGKTISYYSPSQEEYKTTLGKAGVPEVYVNLFAGFAESIRRNEFDETSQDLEKILGRRPTDLVTYLHKLYSK